MISEDSILDDILKLLSEMDPEANVSELKSSINLPLNQVYKINSMIGVSIATALAERYGLPEIPKIRLCDRNDYISLKGLLDHLKNRITGSNL